MKKPLSFLKNQLVNAVLMAALTVPLILVAVSLAPDLPTLAFEGARIQVAQDGSVQLLFDVCIRNVNGTSGGRKIGTAGAQFELMYNSDYLVLSNYDTNEALVDYDSWDNWENDSSLGFHKNPDLYRVDTDGDNQPDKSKDPFAKSNDYVWANGIVHLSLIIDDSIDPDDPNAKGFGMIKVVNGENPDVYYNIFDASDKVVLGTLSFRVLDPDLMPEITQRFDGLVDVVFEENHAKKNVAHVTSELDQLIYFEKKAEGLGYSPWGIKIHEWGDDDYQYRAINDNPTDPRAQAAFTFHFPRTIIKARAAEAELTINAYQAYTDGTVSDIDQALQRYSPAITVTYSDGSEGNFIMPWGRTTDAVDGLPWSATVAYDLNDSSKPVVVDGVPAAGEIAYDPTASRYKPANDDQHYLVQKHFCYEEEDFYGVTQKKTFPVPIDVRLTVTPITLVDVTANDLRRSYILNDTLVDGNQAVQSMGALKLPTQARLITDVPAGGITLTMDIPGWSHPQTYDTDSGTEILRYWPSERVIDPDTNEILSGTGTEMKDLRRDGIVEADGGLLHWPVLADKEKWEVLEANGALLGANRAGDYTFTMAESYGGTPTDFTKPAIQAIYPWLTIPKDNYPLADATRIIVWNDDPDKTPDPEKPPVKPKLEDTSSYYVKYVSTTEAANGQPEFTLHVRKIQKGTNGEDETSANILGLPDGTEFRIKLPDGTELGLGTVGKDAEDPKDEVDLPDWFEGTDGSYTKTPVKNLGPYKVLWGFDLTTNPGDPTENDYGTEREKLRRYINLGGWFYVSIKERGDLVMVTTSAGETGETETETRTPAPETYWSDFIPVYVPPRDNYYTESKEYNFIGDNAGLYPWPGGVSTTVILPPGTYNPVEIQGNAILPVYEEDEDGVITQTRKVERYGLSTTYDGATGAQPGELNLFTVDPKPSPAPSDDWQKEDSTITVGGTTRTITTYGPEVFLDSAVYNAYGKVLNRLTDRGSTSAAYSADAEDATIRVEKTEPSQLLEKVVLEYVDTHGGESSYNFDGTNVTNVIFETRTRGYTMRQDYVLRLRNVGDVDISGISIDTLTDLTGNPIYDKSKDSNPAGGHFVILKPPASFLPAGESTEFVISYVYLLESDGSTPVEYRDKLFITSNSHNVVPTGSTTAGADYLLDFDAQFQVTDSDIHRVFINVIPAQGMDGEGNVVSMPLGTANVIIGLEDVNDMNSMNTSAGPTAYPQGVPVYILISPKDEYTMVAVSAVDSAGDRISIGPFRQPDGVLPDGRLVYVFVMPDYDATVTVTFNEPVSSKLRLSDLRVYADADRYHGEGDPSHTKDTAPECLYPFKNREEWDAVKAHFRQRVWQKGFTDAERTAAAFYTQDDGEKLYLMTKGGANIPDFDSQNDQYLVVLPFDADWAQVEVDLRAVEYIFNGDPIVNQPLENIVVRMTLYNNDNVSQMLASTNTSDIYPQSYSYETIISMPTYAQHGATNDPTTHTSIPFLSPEPGSSKYVRVQLSYTENNVTTTRAYYIELHRAPRQVDATMNYGNSPYGMIMNDPTIVSKSGAKAAFVDNNYTFKGLNTVFVPSVVKENDLTDLHYWLEAWAPPTETWSAPNADWSTTDAVYDPDTGMGSELYFKLSGWKYDADTQRYVVDATTPNVYNLDLNDYAFFAIMGEKFQDPGIARATDSSGRPVNLSKAVLSLEIYTLDDTADKSASAGQLKRFSLPTDPDDLAARTVTFGFLDGTDGTAAVSGDTVRGDWAKWYLTPTGELTQDSTENTLVELRPGRYQLAYTFPDYNNILADPANGVEAEPNYLTVTRDFVVLAPVGDVNADLAVTTGNNSDETLVEGRISPNAGYPALGYMADNYDYAAIFKLRTCDVNNDRNINNIDANAIKEKSIVKCFYLPVGYKPTAATP